MMELRFQGLDITSTLYAVPTISPNGAISAWKGKDSRWRGGFVVRVLWFGFVLRWGKIKLPPKRRVNPLVYELLAEDWPEEAMPSWD